MESPRIAALLAPFLACSLAGCTSDGPHVDWTIGFADATLRAQAVNVSAWILRGGCDGNDRLYEVDLDGMDAAPDPNALPHGRYGFAAEARDASCRPIATGCVERTLPSQADMTIDIALTADHEPPRCPVGLCMQGKCSVDGGTATTDAGAGCADGTVGPTGSCYTAFADTSFDGAEAICVAWGGHLVVLDDAIEGQWLLASTLAGSDAWVGISDAASEGTWVTVTGATPAYLPWDAGEPTNAMNSDCGLVHLASGTFASVRCSEMHAVVCERP